MKYSEVLLATLCIVALVAIGVVLHVFRELFIPLALAALLSVVFQPVVARLRQKGAPMAFALVAVLLALGVTALLLGMVLHASAAPLVDELPRYQPKLESVASNVLGWVNGLGQSLGLRMDNLDSSSLFGATRITAEAVSSVVGTFLRYLGNAGLLLLFMLFMLAGHGMLAAKLRHAFPAERAERIIAALAEIGRQARSYLVIRVALGLIDGVATWLILLLLGVEFAAFWGLLAFLMSFVPYAGWIAAVVFPLIFALLQFDTLTRPLLVLLALGTESAFVGNVLTPKLIASRQNISPLLVLSAMLFWGMVWGPWGVVLSVPLAVTTVIIFEHVEALRPIAVLMRERVPEGD